MGAGVWGGGLLETSRFKPIPWTGDRIPYREPYYSQVPGYIFICAWDSHPCLKKKPHIWPKDKVEKIYCWTNIHDGCSECLKWWTKWKKKKCVWQIVSRLYLGVRIQGFPLTTTDFTQPWCFSMSIYNYSTHSHTKNAVDIRLQFLKRLKCSKCIRLQHVRAFNVAAIRLAYWKRD